MDYPLGDGNHGHLVSNETVLIPILMDYPLGDDPRRAGNCVTYCLNPYSNGLPSRGLRSSSTRRNTGNVLFPILMDYPLGEQQL